MSFGIKRLTVAIRKLTRWTRRCYKYIRKNWI